MTRLEPQPLQRGFTLTELLVVLAVLAILACLGAPALGQAGERMELATASNDLLANLRLARNESIKRRGRVALCKSADGSRCTSTGGWEQGWIVFHDTDNDGVRDEAEPIVHRVGALPVGWRLAGNANVARYISYDPSGTTKLLSGAFQVGTLTVCHASAGPTEARQVILSIAGRPRIQKTTVKNCP
ncbi:GspH/FimT family pseudopilin [Ramlibacter albus]|uniref:Type II secretion system protein H n=1 Tax=Ramlibacter albus TaxID=2079448 RepID=A0A923S5Q3_9BURK|nr:GspH/FimT family pseudopilin [Ramlibacter albus]MBC5768248.1 GspH/FimT family pseudopilin [Ramlibacter albus]